MSSYEINPIGQVRSCFEEKFCIPRQPGLLKHAKGWIELSDEFARPEMWRGLEDFSHIWLHFIFHAEGHEKWNPMVRPPKLGGKTKKGVFATRSPHRPNQLGLSVVKLEKIIWEPRVKLLISAVDILDKTPLIDVKPYVPFSDALPNSVGGFTENQTLTKVQVQWSEKAQAQREYFLPTCSYLFDFVEDIVSQDPRPAYMARQENHEKNYGVRVYGLEVKWHMKGHTATILEIENLSPESVQRIVDNFGDDC